MRLHLLTSIAFHLLFIVFAIFGLPISSRTVMPEEKVIDVELVAELPKVPEVIATPKPTVSATNGKKIISTKSSVIEEKIASLAPKPAPKPKPAPVAKPAPKPKPAPVAKPAPKPKPKPAPVAKPAPKPAPVAKPAPKPAETQLENKELNEPIKLKVKQRPMAPRPRLKPKRIKDLEPSLANPNLRERSSKSDFASMMLKTVQKITDTPSSHNEKLEGNKKSFNEKIATLLKKDNYVPREREKQISPVGKLTLSEIDSIKRQIEQCWLVPAAIGAKDVEKMRVQIRIKLNPNGELREARIVDLFRLKTNTIYKAVAESALRAVRNPRCSRFNLPLNKYKEWKDINMFFDPSEMVGR